MLCRPLLQSTDELEPQDSGLRVSTGKDAGQSAQADEGQEHASASGFYSPTNSYGAASPAGKEHLTQPQDLVSRGRDSQHATVPNNERDVWHIALIQLSCATS